MDCYSREGEIQQQNNEGSIQDESKLTTKSKIGYKSGGKLKWKDRLSREGLNKNKPKNKSGYQKLKAKVKELEHDIKVLVNGFETEEGMDVFIKYKDKFECVDDMKDWDERI